MIYREMYINESIKIKQINGEQYIEKAWREVDGVRQLIDIDWLEPGLPNGDEWHISHFEQSLEKGGKAFGCFNDDNDLVGYAVINGDIFGKYNNYVLLDQLFISLEHRKKGIGKELFRLCCKEAKQMGADKLYICAGSAEETIAFYFAIGCEEAIEINQVLYEMDPRDFQLEYTIN